MDELSIFLDGSCLGNPGRGGWAALLIYGELQLLRTGYAENTTNNIMELTAFLESMKYIVGYTGKIIIHTDSKYLVDGATRYLKGWKSNGWRKSSGEPIANIALWNEIDLHLHRLNIDFVWVRSHNGHPQNEYVDKIAKDVARNGK